MKDIYFITSNKNKAQEASVFLGFQLRQKNIDLPEIQDLDVLAVSKHKALMAFEIVGKPLFVEDTGLYIEELNGFPGAFAKMAVQTLGVEKIAGLVSGPSSAYAKTVITYHDGKVIRQFIGEKRGVIQKNPRGKNNFGWDPIFQPEGEIKTYAEMTKKQKVAVSHRTKAFAKFKKFFT